MIHAGTLTVTVVGKLDFGVSMAPVTVVVKQGGSTMVTPVVTPMGGFASALTYTWNTSSFPAGITATFSTDANGTTRGQINAAPTAASGTQKLRYTAAGGGKSNEFELQFFVGPGLDETVNCAMVRRWTDTRIVHSPSGGLSALAKGWSEGSYANYYGQVLGPGDVNRGILNLGHNSEGSWAYGSSPAYLDFEDFDANYSSGGTYYFLVNYHTSSYYCEQQGVYVADTSDSFTLSVPRVTAVSPSGGVSPGGTLDVYGQGFSGIRAASDVQISGGVTVSSVTVVDDTHLQAGIDTSSATSSTARVMTLTARNTNWVTLGSIGDPVSLRRGNQDFPESTDVSVYVVDATPVIASVQMSGTLYAGDAAGADVVITGYNFGRNKGTLSFCTSPDPNDACAVANIHYDAGGMTWAPDPAVAGLYRIQAHLTADSGTDGLAFYVRVNAVSGNSGLGFQPSPSGSTTPKSGPRGPLAVNGNPNLSLQVTSGGRTLNQGDCAYIDPTPTMPRISAKIVSKDNSPLTGNASWQLLATYQRRVRISETDAVTVTDSGPAGSPSTLGASETWSPQFTGFFGGDARIVWAYNGAAQTSFAFKICGQNPSGATVQSVLSSWPYWFAWKIALHESNASPFCQAGVQACPSYGDIFGLSSAQREGLPTFGAPAGYTLTQVDPVTSPSALWNWREGMQLGKDKLDRLAGPMQYLGEDVREQRAYPYWIRQVHQWNAHNGRLVPENRIPPPSDEIEAPYCRFTMPLDRPWDSTKSSIGLESPTNETNNTYWFGDAVLIKQYNGAPVQYISWLEAAARWSTDKVNRTSLNTVYEVCSCTIQGPPDSCTRLKP